MRTSTSRAYRSAAEKNTRPASESKCFRFIFAHLSTMNTLALGYRCARRSDVKPFPEHRSKMTTPAPSPRGSPASSPSPRAVASSAVGVGVAAGAFFRPRGRPPSPRASPSRAFAIAAGTLAAAADASAISFLSTFPLMFAHDL